MKEHKITVLPACDGGGWGMGGRMEIKLHSANNEINKSEAVSMDDRPNSKYLMCLLHYSVSVKASEGATVTVSAVLAVRSMALRRNGEGIHNGGAFFADLHVADSRYYQRQTSKVPVDKTS